MVNHETAVFDSRGPMVDALRAIIHRMTVPPGRSEYSVSWNRSEPPADHRAPRLAMLAVHTGDMPHCPYDVRTDEDE